MVECVIFDVGGVLLTLGEEHYRQGMVERLGSNELPSEYLDAVPRLQRGELAEESLWTQLAGKPVASNSFDDLWRAGFQPISSMLQLAETVRAHGVRTVILSNTQASHVRMMRTMDFLDGFDPTIFSCEIGLRKPEPEIYRYVLDRLELPGKSVVYIDDIPQYVQAAAKFGIQGIVHTGDDLKTSRELMGILG